MNFVSLLALVHWVVDPMSTVQRLPDSEPTDGERDGIVRIVAAQDEYEPASFVLRSDDERRVQLTLSPLTNETGVAFPAANLDLKVVKVWYQNRNAWYSYFGDCGWKLVPELLLNDENLVRVDETKVANYARLTEADGRVHERWINPPRQFDRRVGVNRLRSSETFQPMKPNFRDAETLQPVRLEKGRYKQFFLTAHVTKDTPAGLYKGNIILHSTPTPNTYTYSIPVSLRVLPFVLPEPRAYGDLTKKFKVGSYAYFGYDYLMMRNGYDLAAAKRLVAPICRNLKAHNQNMFIVASSDFSEERRFFFEEMKKAGLETDELIGFVNAGGDKAAAKRAAAAATRVFGHRNIYVRWGDEPGPKWMIPARSVLENYKDWGFKTYIAGNDMCYHKAGYLYDWFNVSRAPTDGTSTPLWNKAGADSIAWYANQHTGTEDPSLSRRQNGLGAWLTGYTSFCNYAHELGNWNDDSTTYRPMVLAYGAGSGLVDTLAWEGFREGVDDIRYATALVALAHEAKLSPDNRLALKGRKALRYLAEFDRTAGSLSACRLEMVGQIQALMADLGHGPVLPAVVARKAAEPEADISADLAADLAACKKPEQVADVYRKYYLFDEAYEALVASNRLAAAARLAGGEELRRNDHARSLWQKILDNPKSARGDVTAAVLASLGRADFDPTPYLPVALGKTAATTNSFVDALASACFRDSVFLANDDFAGAAKARKLLCGGYAVLKKPVPFKYWRFALLSLAAQGDRAALAACADEARKASDAWKPEEAYLFDLAAAVGQGKTPVSECGAEVPAKKRMDVLCEFGSFIMRSDDEQTVRSLEAYRQKLLKHPQRRRATVGFSPKGIRDAADWADVPVEPLDRQYGGSTEVLSTDVATGDRSAAGAAKGEREHAPELSVCADAWGLHFRLRVADAKAREIEAGLLKGFSYEGYVAPGKDRAYTGIFVNVGPETKLSFYPTSYDNPEHRRMDAAVHPEWCRVRTDFTDTEVTTYFSLSWEIFALTLPKDGDVWDFELLRWSRSCNNAWNGTDSIHGRTTWGELVFALPSAARTAILRRQLFAAHTSYEQEKNPRVNGVLEFWNDPILGDPAFYAAEIAPVVKRLDSYLPRVKADMSADEVEALANEALSGWLTIRQTVDVRRKAYLEARETK